MPCIKIGMVEYWSNGIMGYWRGLEWWGIE
jgi:hypothetical protein